jgi:hypothetical protein
VDNDDLYLQQKVLSLVSIAQLSFPFLSYRVLRYLCIFFSFIHFVLHIHIIDFFGIVQVWSMDGKTWNQSQKRGCRVWVEEHFEKV